VISDDLSRPFLPGMEWDLLSEPISVAISSDNPTLPSGSRRIRLQRDETYRLNTMLEGTIPAGQPGTLTENPHLSIPWISIQGPPGSPKPPFSASVTTSSYTYCFEHCVPTRWLRRQSADSDQLDTYQGDLALRRITRTSLLEGSETWFTEWFLNGSKEDFFYTRFTRRRVEYKYLRHRLDIGFPAVEPFSPHMENPGQRDFVLVDAARTKFLVTRVPKEVGPRWSHNVGIEYYSEWGKPDAETREAISEIVGFVMGRQLLFVGASSFNEAGRALTCSATSPWGDNPMSLCGLADHAPVLCGQPRQGMPYPPQGCEAILQELVPAYLEKREAHRLKDAMWRYWISYIVPPEAMLPAIATAVEILADGWYKSQASKSQGAYVDPDRFAELVRPELQAITEKLEGYKYAERMIRRISHAYEVGANQRVPFFLEELDLPIDRAEKQALRERNPAVHGGSYASEEGYKLLMRQVTVYRTLFHRIVLKLLGFQGNYVDYSAHGQPLRHIDDPVGGDG